MAHVKRLLEAKFKRELQRAKRRQELEQLDETQREAILAEHRDRQKMLHLITN